MSAQFLINGGCRDTSNRSTRPLSLVWSSMFCATPYEVSTCSVAWPAPMSTPVTVKGRSHHSPSSLVPTSSTISGAASVRTPIGPIGQAELSMSTVCSARRPGVVWVSMWTPYAASAGAIGPLWAQPQARATTTAAVNATPRRRARLALCLGAGPGNVQHNLELQQRCPGGHGGGALAGMRLDRRPGRPLLERLLGLPVGHHEVAVLTLDRP